LYSNLSNDVSVKDLKLVKLPKSGGVVSRDPTFRRKSRKQTIKEYFYGFNHDLCPHSLNLPFTSVTIYKIVAGTQAPSSTLPLGMESTLDSLEPIKVLPSYDLKYFLVGVSYAKKVEELMECNIAGFVFIKEINFERNEIVVLSPSSGNLPGEFLLLTSIKFLESD